MLPDYGIRDEVFAVKGAAFVELLSHFLREQIVKYIPGVASVRVVGQAMNDEHAASVRIEWTLNGSNVPHNLVYPVRQLRGE